MCPSKGTYEIILRGHSQGQVKENYVISLAVPYCCLKFILLLKFYDSPPLPGAFQPHPFSEALNSQVKKGCFQQNVVW